MTTQLTKNQLIAMIAEQSQAAQAARDEATQLRALMAQTLADHNAQLAVLNRKLFQLNSDRAKWEARARAGQTTRVTGSSFAERAAAARDVAMQTGRSVAVGGV